MLRLAYPGRLRGMLLYGAAEHELIDLSQEGARAVVPSAGDVYRVGGCYSVVLSLVSRAILVTEAEVTRISPGEVAFRFCGHFPFDVMLEEHCAVLAGERAPGVERSA